LRYVEELRRYVDIADHENRRLVEPDDELAHLYLIRHESRVIGTARLSWGADAGALNDRIVEQYDLKPFLDAVPHRHLAVGERLMFAPEYRGGPLLFKFISEFLVSFSKQGIQLFFGDCEPHLLNSYQSLGYRPYTQRHVNKAETGYLIPIVFVTGDLDYLRSIGAPLLNALKDSAEVAGVPENLDQLLAGHTGIEARWPHGRLFLPCFRGGPRVCAVWVLNPRDDSSFATLACPRLTATRWACNLVPWGRDQHVGLVPTLPAVPAALLGT
jgi:hypothetical protein